MWTKYNYEHPVLVATYGMLPGESVDMTIMDNITIVFLQFFDKN